MPNKNVFEDLGWIDSFLLKVVVDLRFDMDAGEDTPRTRLLIQEAQNFLVERGYDADALYVKWLKQGEDYEDELT